MRQSSGFTLVEVMISSVILLTSATGMVSLYKKMTDMHLARFYTDIAVRLAREKVQDLKDFQALQGQYGLQGKTSYIQIKSNTGGVLPPGKVKIQPFGATSKTLIFERHWQVTNGIEWEEKTVTVTISWQRDKNTKQSFMLSSVLAPVPPHRHVHLVKHYIEVP